MYVFILVCKRVIHVPPHAYGGQRTTRKSCFSSLCSRKHIQSIRLGGSIFFLLAPQQLPSTPTWARVWLSWNCVTGLASNSKKPTSLCLPPRRGSKGVGSYTYTCKGGLNYFFLYVWVGRVQMHSRLNLGGIHHLSLSQSSPSLLRGPPPDFSPALRVHQGPSGGDQTQVLSYQLRPLNDLFKK